MACKDSKLVQASDFFFSGLHLVANTSNPVGSRVTPVGVTQISGLKHSCLLVGSVTTNPKNCLITKVLQKGDVFVIPVTIGLVHSQQNVEYGNAVAIAALSSQNPGIITIANAVFGSNPDIAIDVLAMAFQRLFTIVEPSSTSEILLDLEA
ncbi:hypothetical protein SO802_007044 [Lithocarpus litseifolius]|uniref:Germin-like protein n=1 Tax=Lithocarpus litseifolius TaxID=425828 RepID=A0AAW2DNE2_9ROSI